MMRFLVTTADTPGTNCLTFQENSLAITKTDTFSFPWPWFDCFNDLPTPKPLMRNLELEIGALG
jgi:hypothetical protein